MTNQVLSYGGGRQTVALLVLIKRGVLPKPDRIGIADTGRENPSTWEYREEVAEPLARSMGLTIEIASHKLAYVDLYGHNGDLLLPVWTKTGYLGRVWRKRRRGSSSMIVGIQGLYRCLAI